MLISEAPMFELHPRLQADTRILGDLPLCRVLLAKDSQYPWLILVPRVANLREIHHLAPEQQQQLMPEQVLLQRVLMVHRLIITQSVVSFY